MNKKFKNNIRLVVIVLLAWDIFCFLVAVISKRLKGYCKQFISDKINFNGRYFDCDDSDTCSEQLYSGDDDDDLYQPNATDNATEHKKSPEPLSPTDKIGDDTSLSYCESLSDLSTDDGSERDKMT